MDKIRVSMSMSMSMSIMDSLNNKGYCHGIGNYNRGA